MLKNLAGSTTAKIRDAVPFFKIYGTNLEDKTSLLKKNSWNILFFSPEVRDLKLKHKPTPPNDTHTHTYPCQ